MKRGEKWFSEKLWKRFRSDSFSIRSSRIESSRFRARVAKGRPAFRDRITRRSQESKIVYRGVGADFEIQKNISANSEQGSIKRGYKWFYRKTSKIFWQNIFGPTHSRYVPPVSRAPASELVLQRGGLPSEIALPGEPSSPKLCI